MEIKTATFIRSYAKEADMPMEVQRPEFAFIGRSNVGKSSLINMLTRRKNLAKISATPGKTRLINSFLINEKWVLNDLPGYGYARVSKAERSVFGDLITGYLKNRKQLSCAMVLIDSRHPPLAIDLEFLEWCALNAVPVCIILTKTDKNTLTRNAENRELFKAALFKRGWEELPLFFESSSVKASGRDQILDFIHSIITEQGII